LQRERAFARQRIARCQPMLADMGAQGRDHLIDQPDDNGPIRPCHDNASTLHIGPI
jgi:hypothetical protein